MARKIPINWDDVEKLCSLHCTGEEIAAFLKISYDTLERRIKSDFKMTFAEYYKKYSSSGKLSLRRKQFEMALKGNISMLIWLGKQYLDQADRQELTGRDGKSIKVESSQQFDFSEMSDEEVRQFIALGNKASSNSSRK